MKVPDGMLEAARKAHKQNEAEPGVFLTEKIIESALQWLDAQLSAMQNATPDTTWFAALEGVRRMFLAEPEMPQQTKEMIKPCPWEFLHKRAGEAAVGLVIKPGFTGNTFYYQCAICNARGPLFLSHAEALAGWNVRTIRKPLC